MTWKTICFDFDGTLADTLPLTFHCLKAVFEKYDNQTYSNHELIDMFGPTEDGIIKNHLKNKDKFDLAVEMYYRLYEQDHDSFVDHNEDIERMLHYLKYKGIKLGVMTGKSRRAFAISSTLCGLSHFFDVVITGDEVQHPKPHPEGLLKVMKELGSTPQEMIFIGDSMADIQAGKRANVTTAGVHWLDTYQSDHFETKPDYIWTHVDEFVSLFQNRKE
ncbi:HAD-IA family hydrolase [Terrilactibacillus sp. BCM23-1]|uniref:HAD-IA family hydrolase n=1 Tax=Terrilactibacillus tamarindi TaxID=2599694 RepID=A0A6N8CRS0_9BACI|nr:HAD family hydrolase [Terrilactibacillus tamarindi]MTT32939.1 HAD-IA family hydrolase [Terrilactibacillus tamarindi]